MLTLEVRHSKPLFLTSRNHNFEIIGRESEEIIVLEVFC